MGAEIWAWILIAIYPVVCFTFCIIVYLKRNNIFLRCRVPTLLIMQNLGGLICVEILGSYEAKRPDFPCRLFYVGYLCAYCIFGIPMVMRVWIYCVSYHISLLKTLYRPTFFRDWAKTTWFFRHKWIAEKPFVTKLFIVLALLCILLTVISLVFPGSTGPQPRTNSCSWKYGYVGLIFVVTYAVTTLVLGALIWRAADVYGVKREFTAVFCFWLVCILAFVIYTTPVREANKTFSGSNLIILPNVLTLFTCNLVPIYYAMKFERANRGELSKSKAHFRTLLLNVDFRNVFYVYLTKQFCQENLLFYEVVMYWKDLDENDPTRQAKLRSIIDVFVEDNSVCQVNIADYVRTTIIETSNYENAPNTIFDEAVEALIQDMFENSYQQFRNSRKGNASDSGYSEFSFESASA